MRLEKESTCGTLTDEEESQDTSRANAMSTSESSVGSAFNFFLAHRGESYAYCFTAKVLNGYSAHRGESYACHYFTVKVLNGYLALRGESCAISIYC